MMEGRLRTVFSAAAAVLLGFLISVFSARAAGDDPGVACRAVSVVAEGSSFAVLEVEVPRGWHMYAPGSLVGLPATVSAERSYDVWYPDPLRMADGSLSWEGIVRIVIRAASDDTDGRASDSDSVDGAGDAFGIARPIRGVLAGQICTMGRCLRQELSFEVSGPGLPVHEAAVREVLASGRMPVRSGVIRAPEKAPPAADVGMLLGMLGSGGNAPMQACDAAFPKALEPFPEFFPRSAESGAEADGFVAAVLLGFAAGFLLNFMPCVLPVLGIKIGSLLRAADGAESKVREFSLFYALGTAVFFTLLALGLGAAGAIWGGLFQSEAFVMVLMAAVFLMALSLFGVFSLPVIDPAGCGALGGPKLEAFASGAFATLLATPCSGPLLGGVLGWAFLQPPFVLGACAFSVGLGMGGPWLVLAARPSLAERLPRPGAWMEFLERGMAFLLMATALYLMSLLPEARHFAAAVLLFAAGFCAWVAGRFFGPASGLKDKTAGLVLCIASAICAFAIMQPSDPPAYAMYSRSVFMENLGRRNIILDFTADWCPNCKVLEKTVLTKARIAELEKRYDAMLLVVDLTAKDAEKQALLEAMGGHSIPLTALIGSKDASHPLVLRDMYTPSALEGAAEECFGKHR